MFRSAGGIVQQDWCDSTSPWTFNMVAANMWRSLLWNQLWQTWGLSLSLLLWNLPCFFFIFCVYASIFLSQCSNDSNLTFPVNVLLEALALKKYYLDRHLHILLYLAERAWSYAMEIKQAPQGASARAHMHLIRRLSKAAQWGDLFSRLCSEKADSRTALEAAVFMWNLSGNF